MAPLPPSPSSSSMALFSAFLVLVSLPTLLVARSEPTFYDPARVSRLSWRPRAFLYRGFVSHEECDHLIELAKDKLEKSMVADDESGDSVASDIRTSSGMFLEKHQVLVLAFLWHFIC
ncbi:probable prolyl 4-hydroxylase 7 [Ananas comosus]|uniref:Probable prolyl 4-hydroxylase 7 n=1 Tax=Ananas comosus TaxID=4615 RepID=A0A6P5EC09_ANACO|nr:probable prolyl 4-hydroxylase 7 [Ananas comosus]